MATPTPKRTEDRRKRPFYKKANTGSLSSHALGVAERRRKAIALRLQGKTFAAIGTELGVSSQRAHQLVDEELRGRSFDQVEEYRQFVLERLEALLTGHFPKARAGDLPATDIVLSILAQERKLLGLDVPPGQFGARGSETRRAASGSEPIALTFVTEKNGRGVEASSVAELNAVRVR